MSTVSQGPYVYFSPSARKQLNVKSSHFPDEESTAQGDSTIIGKTKISTTSHPGSSAPTPPAPPLPPTSQPSYRNVKNDSVRF